MHVFQRAVRCQWKGILFLYINSSSARELMHKCTVRSGKLHDFDLQYYPSKIDAVTVQVSCWNRCSCVLCLGNNQFDFSRFYWKVVKIQTLTKYSSLKEWKSVGLVSKHTCSFEKVLFWFSPWSLTQLMYFFRHNFIHKVSGDFELDAIQTFFFPLQEFLQVVFAHLKC